MDRDKAGARGSSRRPTSTDVARAAKVSRATVSCVLNGKEQKYGITPQTRDRVLAAAARLGYQRNAAALALRAGRTEVVLVQMPDWPLEPPTTEAVVSIFDELEELGYTPLVHFQRAARPRSLARACQRVQPVGVIAPGSQLPSDVVKLLRMGGTRAVFAIDERPLAHAPTFVIDQHEIGQVAAEHLADRGYEHVLALVADEPDRRKLSEDRVEGVALVARERGLSLRSVAAPLDQTAIARVLDKPLGRARERTAIFAFNDAYALAVLEVLRERVVAVPVEMALIGCDDSDLAQRSRPRLTTVRLSAHDIWRRIARRLDEMIAGDKDGPTVIRAVPSVIPGETT